MSKRVVLITGATDGLGRATALRFARAGDVVLLHGRHPERLHSARRQLMREAPDATVRGYLADFLSLSEIASLIARIRLEEPHIDILINNAGVGIEDSRQTTKDGHEKVMQVNHLSTHAVTLGLQDLLRTSHGRAICVSSSSQQAVDFSDPQYTRGWDGLHAYARSKWAQAAFAAGMARRWRDGGPTIHSLHPGTLMPTKMVVNRYPVVDSLERGVEAVWALASHPDPLSINGEYFNGTSRARALESVYDEQMQDRLLALSEALLAGVRHLWATDGNQASSASGFVR